MLRTKIALKQKYQEEKVFVVPHHQIAYQNKFTLETDKNSLEKLAKYDDYGAFIYRYEAEYNYVFQQLIPYVVIKNSEDMYYVSERLKGDERLVSTYSLGFGGHISEEDGPTNCIINGCIRELKEELIIDVSDCDLSLIGYVRDIASSTAEHIGFVFELTKDSVEINEKNNLNGFWMTKQDLINQYHKFESWAKYIIDHICG